MGLKFIALTGEPVVDYALRFKSELGWNNTWVSGYNNELLCYLPFERVLSEGGYEGTEGMAEYRHPTTFAPGLEGRINRLASASFPALTLLAIAMLCAQKTLRIVAQNSVRLPSQSIVCACIMHGRLLPFPGNHTESCTSQSRAVT